VVEEQPIAEQATETPAETAAPAEDRRDSSGPGFLRGVILGAIAGAVAAMLLAPKAGEEDASTEVGEAGGVVGQLRARVREASAEARQAAQEAEQAKRARFRELIEDDRP
jgi:gas vesicle protein